MGMSAFYGSTDEQEAIATIQRGLDLGVTFVDTAEIYGPYTNEQLVGRAVADRRDEVVVATKFGIRITSMDPPERVTDGSPENVRRSVDESLRRLGIGPHRPLLPAPRRPQRADRGDGGRARGAGRGGKVRYIGLSEASPETIRAAHAEHPMTAVQTEYSLWSRDVEQEVLPTLRELGIGWSPTRRSAAGSCRAGSSRWTISTPTTGAARSRASRERTKRNIALAPKVAGAGARRRA